MHLTRRRLPALLAASLALLYVGAVTSLAAGRDAVAAAASGGSVRIQNVAFHPGTLTIHRGQSVTWHWLDAQIQAQHSVTSVGHLRFRSAGVRLTGTYTVRFARPGTYAYTCTVHPFMHGRIVVR